MSVRYAGLLARSNKEFPSDTKLLLQKRGIRLLQVRAVLGPRLLAVAFSVILLISVFLIVQRLHGTPTAAIATGLLLASPGFLELSNSCMLEIPSLSTAIAALALLLLYRLVFEDREHRLYAYKTIARRIIE